eukprot:CFRG7883T1
MTMEDVTIKGDKSDLDLPAPSLTDNHENDNNESVMGVMNGRGEDGVIRYTQQFLLALKESPLSRVDLDLELFKKDKDGRVVFVDPSMGAGPVSEAAGGRGQRGSVSGPGSKQTWTKDSSYNSRDSDGGMSAYGSSRRKYENIMADKGGRDRESRMENERELKPYYSSGSARDRDFGGGYQRSSIGNQNNGKIRRRESNNISMDDSSLRNMRSSSPPSSSNSAPTGEEFFGGTTNPGMSRNGRNIAKRDLFEESYNASTKSSQRGQESFENRQQSRDGKREGGRYTVRSESYRSERYQSSQPSWMDDQPDDEIMPTRDLIAEEREKNNPKKSKPKEQSKTAASDKDARPAEDSAREPKNDLGSKSNSMSRFSKFFVGDDLTSTSITSGGGSASEQVTTSSNGVGGGSRFSGLFTKDGSEVAHKDTTPPLTQPHSEGRATGSEDGTFNFDTMMKSMTAHVQTNTHTDAQDLSQHVHVHAHGRPDTQQPPPPPPGLLHKHMLQNPQQGSIQSQQSAYSRTQHAQQHPPVDHTNPYAQSQPHVDTTNPYAQPQPPPQPLHSDGHIQTQVLSLNNDNTSENDGTHVGTNESAPSKGISPPPGIEVTQNMAQHAQPIPPYDPRYGPPVPPTGPSQFPPTQPQQQYTPHQGPPHNGRPLPPPHPHSHMQQQYIPHMQHQFYQPQQYQQYYGYPPPTPPPGMHPPQSHAQHVTQHIPTGPGGARKMGGFMPTSVMKAKRKKNVDSSGNSGTTSPSPGGGDIDDDIQVPYPGIQPIPPPLGIGYPPQQPYSNYPQQPPHSMHPQQHRYPTSAAHESGPNPQYGYGPPRPMYGQPPMSEQGQPEMLSRLFSGMGPAGNVELPSSTMTVEQLEAQQQR